MSNELDGVGYVEQLRLDWGESTDGASWEMWLESAVAKLWDELAIADSEHSKEMHAMEMETQRSIKAAEREAYAEAEQEMRHEYRGQAEYGEF